MESKVWCIQCTLGSTQNQVSKTRIRRNVVLYDRIEYHVPKHIHNKYQAQITLERSLWQIRSNSFVQNFMRKSNSLKLCQIIMSAFSFVL